MGRNGSEYGRNMVGIRVKMAGCPAKVDSYQMPTKFRAECVGEGKDLLSRYIQENGEPETIPDNPGIRRFVWEHFQDLNCIVQRMKYSGGTFSGYKSFLCRSEITVLGHQCTYGGRLPDQTRVSKIVKWGPCKDLTDVRAFLGTIGVCRLFIRDFSHRAHHLIKLT